MAAYRVAGHNGVEIELDLCHACHGIWFDGNENLRMSPQGVIDLFGDLHQHRDDPHTPLAQHRAGSKIWMDVVILIFQDQLK